jgi:hypothetical protein
MTDGWIGFDEQEPEAGIRWSIAVVTDRLLSFSTDGLVGCRLSD